MSHGAPPAKPVNFFASVARIFRLMKPDSLRIAIVAVMAIAAVALQVIAPKILGNATDTIFNGLLGKMAASIVGPDGTKAQAVTALRQGGHPKIADMLGASGAVPGQGIDFTQLGWILVGVLAIYVGAAFFNWAQGFITAGVVQRCMYRLRERVQAKLDTLPLKYFDKNTRGDVLSRVTNDIDNLSQTLNQAITQLLVSVLTVIGVLVMMFSISWLLALIALVAVPLAALATVLIAKRSQRQFAEQWKATGTLNGHIEEMFTGHEIVKAFGQQSRSLATFDGHNSQMYVASAKAQFLSGMMQPAMRFVSNLSYVAVAVAGGIRVANGQITIGGVQAFIQYSRQFTQPLAQLGSMANLLQSGVASAERVFQILDAEDQSPDPVPAAYPDVVRGDVEFEHVSFRYDKDTPLIEDLSLHARPGQTIAIVGPTGAGKTTLVNLLMRFYEIDSGSIMLDGVDTRSMSRDGLRANFGMVLQDAWLFGGTIRENLMYGAQDATEEQMIAAAEATYVDHFVRVLPDGYDTMLDENGAALSTGQRQLLTIARAFLADPAVLILDEATSSVDTRTELLIQHAMNRLRHSRTSFVIAHRLSTIRDAEAILVMQGGSIVETGRHNDLLEADGFYAELYNSQFAAPEVEDEPAAGA
ncbi:ABC transporter ATP-binding protein [Spelaeicoccus albus]|uniref:Fatty acid ABC transporter ATP-binding/permease protein n=1 Tax=Spelaeicoccus albus TaxID=1280376 RepID=A0A7Z0D520_9MICO|nr:ABC transporter ATP-binding protein [Spelaeicoccus albus]NYI68941.1 ATP-binding cassette subfamily B protein [Spelaeicoccus albus]